MEGFKKVEELEKEFKELEGKLLNEALKNNDFELFKNLCKLSELFIEHGSSNFYNGMQRTRKTYGLY